LIQAYTVREPGCE